MIDGGAAVAGGAMGYVTVGAVVVVDVVGVAVVAAVADPTETDPTRWIPTRCRVPTASHRPRAPRAHIRRRPRRARAAGAVASHLIRLCVHRGPRGTGRGGGPVPREFQADARARRNVPSVTVRPSSETPSTATAKVGNAASLLFRPEVPVSTGRVRAVELDLLRDHTERVRCVATRRCADGVHDGGDAGFDRNVGGTDEHWRRGARGDHRSADGAGRKVRLTFIRVGDVRKRGRPVGESSTAGAGGVPHHDSALSGGRGRRVVREGREDRAARFAWCATTLALAPAGSVTFPSITGGSRRRLPRA